MIGLTILTRGMITTGSKIASSISTWGFFDSNVGFVPDNYIPMFIEHIKHFESNSELIIIPALPLIQPTFIIGAESNIMDVHNHSYKKLLNLEDTIELLPGMHPELIDWDNEN